MLLPKRFLYTGIFALSTAIAGFNLQADDSLKPRSHVYVVYTGKENVSEFSAAKGEIDSTKTVFLLTDLANPANYSLMVVGDKNDPGYHIYTRVLSPDGTYTATYDDGVTGTSDPSDNLFASVTYRPPAGGILPLNTSSNPVKMSGIGALKFSLVGTDVLSSFLFATPLNANYIVFPFTHTYSRTGEIFATGPLTGLTQTPQVVIPANALATQPEAVAAASSPFVKLPPYQINPITTPYANCIGTNAKNAKVVPYVVSLGGNTSYYDYDATLLSKFQGTFSPLAVANGGTINLRLNPTLSALANVGGSYPVQSTGPVTIPLSLEIQPVKSPLEFSHSATVYETFLYHVLITLSGNHGLGYVPGQTNLTGL